MSELRVGDVIVNPTDGAQGNRAHMKAIGKVFADYWLEGHPQTEPLYAVADGVVYQVDWAPYH